MRATLFPLQKSQENIKVKEKDQHYRISTRKPARLQDHQAGFWGI